MSENLKLSIVIPVYNEEKFILEVLNRIENLDCGLEKEIVIVDDASADNTKNILKSTDKYKIFYHEKNQGKGASVNTALKHVTGDIIVIQDADLEYNPSDIKRLLQPILKNECDVVYGSRFMSKSKFMLKQFLANKFLTFLSNILYGSALTDMETCYKMFKKEVVEGIEIKSKKFDFDPEITSKILKKGIKIKEIPIEYNYRNFSEGKKINHTDGIQAIFALIKYKFTD